MGNESMSVIRLCIMPRFGVSFYVKEPLAQSRHSIYNLSAMIYLDYSATTPVDPRVVEAMTPYFSASFGNPSSVHRYGQVAEAAIESARETVASILNCRPGRNYLHGLRLRIG